MALVTLTPACRELRRLLGPMAWAVLEDAAMDAASTDSAVVVRTSARLVAEHLGIQPGTAARALRRLREEGLVALVREQRADGRFGLAVYQLTDIVGVAVTGDGAPYAAAPHVVERAVGSPHVAPRCDADRDVVAPPMDVPGDRRLVAPPVPAASRPAVAPAKPAHTAQPSLWEEH